MNKQTKKKEFLSKNSVPDKIPSNKVPSDEGCKVEGISRLPLDLEVKIHLLVELKYTIPVDLIHKPSWSWRYAMENFWRVDLPAKGYEELRKCRDVLRIQW